MEECPAPGPKHVLIRRIPKPPRVITSLFTLLNQKYRYTGPTGLGWYWATIKGPYVCDASP